MSVGFKYRCHTRFTYLLPFSFIYFVTDVFVLIQEAPTFEINKKS